MERVLTTNQAINLSVELREQKKRIVLTGGCFDILHLGHFSLLEQAKKQGDILMVLLESDEKIKELKGEARPFHTQVERATMLALLRPVDYVILLPPLKSNEDYDFLIEKLNPSVIATTENDPKMADKKRQAKKISAKVKEVTAYIPEKSTSNLIKILLEEN